MKMGQLFGGDEVEDGCRAVTINGVDVGFEYGCHQMSVLMSSVDVRKRRKYTF